MSRILIRPPLLAVAAVLTALVITGCQSSQDDSDRGANGGSTDAGGTLVSTDYKIPDQIHQLVLTGHAGDITLSTGTGPVTVSESIRYTDDKPVTSHTVNGGIATLRAEQCQHVRAVNGSCVVDWEIHAPAGTNLDLTSSSGDISFTGFGGVVSAKANAGDVEGRELTSRAVTAQSSSGNVKLVFGQSPEQVSATTAAGDVTIGVPVGARYAVQADSATEKPDVTVQTDPKSPHKITAKTSAGAISVATGEG